VFLRLGGLMLFFFCAGLMRKKCVTSPKVRVWNE